MAYQNTYQELTRSLRRRRERDGRDDYLYNRKTNQASGTTESLISDFMKIGVHFLTQVQQERQAKEDSIKTADMNFFGSANTQKAIQGLSKESYEKFLKTNSEKIRKGTALIDKYRSDSKEYEEGKLLIQQATQATQNAAANKARFALVEQRVAGIDINNMDNTVSWEAATYTEQINNGTFWVKNHIYLDEMGNFMTKAKKGKRKIVNQATYDNVPSAFQDNYMVGTVELGDKTNGNMLSNDQEQLLTLTEIAAGDGVSHTQAYNNPSQPKLGYQVVTRQATNIFDLPLGYKNQQLGQNSLQNQIEGYIKLQQKAGFLHLTASDGMGVDIANTPGAEKELYKDVQTMLASQNQNQLRSWVHNGIMEIPITTTINGVETTEIENVHPAEVLLWEYGIDNPELSEEELMHAEKTWEKGEAFTMKTDGDPTVEGDKAERKITFKDPAAYQKALGQYKVISKEFAANTSITIEQKRTLTDMIVENAMAANKVGVEKYAAAEEQKKRDSWKMTNAEKREKVRNTRINKQFKEFNRTIWNPGMNNGKGGWLSKTPQQQIDWFKSCEDCAGSTTARRFADNNNLRFLDIGDIHPSTGDKIIKGEAGYYYISDKNDKRFIKHHPDKIVNGSIVQEAYDEWEPTYSIFNYGRDLEIDKAF